MGFVLLLFINRVKKYVVNNLRLFILRILLKGDYTFVLSTYKESVDKSILFDQAFSLSIFGFLSQLTLESESRYTLLKLFQSDKNSKTVFGFIKLFIS